MSGLSTQVKSIIKEKIIMSAILTYRLARSEDLDALRGLMEAAISKLQKPYLNELQIESSRSIMGLDTQLIEDKTYFIVDTDGDLAGCGGWSRRATLFGGDHSPDRSSNLLNPFVDAARIRAMYTHPNHTRKGVGRLILSICEKAAIEEGFKKIELMATMAGEPFYRACGYEALERVVNNSGGVEVPLLRMGKLLQ